MSVGTIPVGKVGALVVLVASAVLEVGGDAVIRRGLRGGGLALVALGMAILSAYGALVNLLDIHFAEVLGAYVGIFAVVSVLAGAALFKDRVAASTWIGLAFILAGSLVIQAGRGR